MYSVSARIKRAPTVNRRIGLRRFNKHLRVTWADSRGVDRKVFTDGEYKKIAKPWARKNRYGLQRYPINPYPWLVLADHTQWPTPALCVALNELGRQLKRKLYLREGLRSREQQLAYWNAALKRYGNPYEAGKWVAVPYTSNHGKGRAADVGVGAFYGTNIGDYPGARDRAARLGLFWPMSWEPWHVEVKA
jgi:hypothetical protein